MALVPHTGGLTVSWVARALSGTPFSLTNDTHRSGSATARSPSRSRPATTPAPALMPYTVDDYEASATARAVRASSSSTCGLATHQPDGPAARDLRRGLQRHQPRELRQPGREPGQHEFPAADRILDQHDAADAAARRAFRLLNAAGHRPNSTGLSTGRVRHPACSPWMACAVSYRECTETRTNLRGDLVESKILKPGDTDFRTIWPPRPRTAQPDRSAIKGFSSGRRRGSRPKGRAPFSFLRRPPPRFELRRGLAVALAKAELRASARAAGAADPRPVD